MLFKIVFIKENKTKQLKLYNNKKNIIFISLKDFFDYFIYTKEDIF